MKLSYRDKVILITLLVIFVWVIGVMFFIKPKFEELDDANKEFDAQVVVLNDKKKQIEEDEGLEDRVKEAYKNVTNIANNFYDKMTTDEVSTLVDNLLDDKEVKITNANLSISQYSSATLDFINGTPEEAATDIDKIANQNYQEGEEMVEEASSQDTINGPITVPAYIVSFSYSSSFDGLKKFLENLRSNKQKSLVVTNCSIQDVNEEVITGDVEMVLMMMPRMKDPLKVDKEASAKTDSSEKSDDSSKTEDSSSKAA